MAKEKVELKASKREDVGKKTKRLRVRGLVPAVVYGRKFKSTVISVDLKEFKKKVLQSEAGRNLIFSLKLGENGKGKSVPVITQYVQRNPLNDEIIHIDFMHVVMDEEIKTKVPVELIGMPFGVKEEGGVLVHGLRDIEVKCLPGDIPDKFEVDVSSLAINTSLYVSDLKVTKKVEILASPTDMIANVSPPTKEEVVAPPVLTPEEAAAAAEAAEAGEAMAEEEVKEKAAPGTAPAEKAPAEKPAKEEKK